MPTIARCWFCGGQDVKVGEMHIAVTPVKPGFKGRWWIVYCAFCHCQAKSHLDKDEAIEFWNRGPEAGSDFTPEKNDIWVPEVDEDWETVN